MPGRRWSFPAHFFGKRFSFSKTPAKRAISMLRFCKQKRPLCSRQKGAPGAPASDSLGFCQRLPPGGKLSPQATDEGNAFGRCKPFRFRQSETPFARGKGGLCFLQLISSCWQLRKRSRRRASPGLRPSRSARTSRSRWSRPAGRQPSRRTCQRSGRDP